jgi:small-conductance mechanosensitive channel
MKLSPRKKRIACLAGLIAVVVWFPGTIASAQVLSPKTPEIEVPADPQAEAQAAPAIPLEVLSDGAVKTNAKLNSLLPKDAFRQRLKHIDSKLDLVIPEVDSWLEKTGAVLVDRPNTYILRKHKAKHSELLERLQPWITELDIQLVLFHTALQQVNTIQAVWAETSKVAWRDGATETTLTRIAAVRGRIDEVRSIITEQRDQTLAVRDRLVKPSSALAASLEQVRSVSEARIKGLFEINWPPLWSPQVRESLREEWKTHTPQHFFQQLQEGALERVPLLGIQLPLFLVLLLGLRWLRDRIRIMQSESHYDLQDVMKVFEVPWAMALLITLYLTTPVLSLTNSVSFVEVAIVAVGVMAIARRFVVPAATPLIWGLMILYFLVFSLVYLEMPTLQRIAFLVEMVGALGFLFWFLRWRIKKIPMQLPQAPFLWLLDPTIRVVAAPALVLATVATLIGWVDFATVLGTSILLGGFLIIGVFVYLIVFQSLATLALFFWPLRLLHMVSQHRQLIRRRLEWLLRVLAVGLWVALLVKSLGIDPVIDGITQMLSASASIGALSVSASDIIVFVLIVWFSILLARFINFVLQEDVFTRVRTGRGVPQAISGVVRYTLILLGFFVALAAAGIELGKLSIVAGGLGVGIGFGLQNVVNNFVSGLILLFERPIGVGDIIEMPDMWGRVKNIGIRASVIRKFDGSEVIVPNAMLVSDKVTNWTLSDNCRRMDFDVGVEYGTPAQSVIDLLLGVAKANPKVLRDPLPQAFFVNFGDSALEFRLRAWVYFDDGLTIRSELAVAIQEDLKQAGIGVPFPQRDLHLVSVSPNAVSDLGTATRPSSHPTSTSDPSNGS